MTWVQCFFSVFLLYHMDHLISSPIRRPEQKFTFRSFLAVCFCALFSLLYRILIMRFRGVMRFTQVKRILSHSIYICYLQQKSCESINIFLILSSPIDILLYNAVWCCHISAATQNTQSPAERRAFIQNGFLLSDWRHCPVSYPFPVLKKSITI